MLYLGKKTPGICDRCGRRVKHSSLKSETIRGRDTNNKVCKDCWDEDHPQNWYGSQPSSDKQSIPDAQPEPDLLNSRSLWGFDPVGAQGNAIVSQTGLLRITAS